MGGCDTCCSFLRRLLSYPGLFLVVVVVVVHARRDKKVLVVKKQAISRQRQELQDLGRRQKVGTFYSALSPFFVKDIVE